MRPDETELLVVDNETDEYYTNIGYTIRSSQPNVIRKTSQPVREEEPARKMSISDSESEKSTDRSDKHVQQHVNGDRRRDSNSSNSSEEVRHRIATFCFF